VQIEINMKTIFSLIGWLILLSAIGSVEQELRSLQQRIDSQTQAIDETIRSIHWK